MSDSYYGTALYEDVLNLVERDGMNLSNVANQTPEMCLAAVKGNGFALEFVENQTSEICLAAVQQNSYVLRYVKNQTTEICLAAVFSACEQLRAVEVKEILDYIRLTVNSLIFFKLLLKAECLKALNCKLKPTFI